jgi:hypothetical protein
MEVNGVSSQTEGIIPSGEAIRTKPKVRHRERVNPANDEIPDSDGLVQGDTDKAKGVIRNLLDGHYKGVADLRLRIIHFEELSKIENNNLKEVADDKVVGLLSAVNSAVSNLLELNQPPQVSQESEGVEDLATTVSGLHQEFTASVNQLLEDFGSSDNPSKANLITGIEDFFETFITSLRDLLTPSTEEPLPTSNPIEEEGLTAELESLAIENPTESEPESSDPVETDYTNYISEVSSVFTIAIADLTEALNNLAVLPELTEPTGNGVAYDKFLAIYNEMRGVETIDSEITNSEGLDGIG